MAITINGTTGITTPEVVMDNGTADGGQVVLKSSGYSNWNIDNYSGSLRAYYNATEYFKVSATGDLQFNSGYGSVATAYGCRAWGNFNGTGTVAIRASANVTSITDNGTGDYTINFTNAMTDANYSCVGSTGGNVAGVTVNAPYNGATAATGSIRIGTSTSAIYTDASQVNVAIFR